MKSVSARVSEETYEEIEALADERGTSVSDVVRDLIRKGREYESLEAERDDLRRQLAAVNRRQQDVGELVEYVEEERSLQQRREARERLKETAGVLTRAKWWVTGMPDPDVGDEEK